MKNPFCVTLYTWGSKYWWNDVVIVLLYLTIRNGLKVSKFRKQIFLFSFEPKNERNYFLISALRFWISKMGQIKKIKVPIMLNTPYSRLWNTHRGRLINFWTFFRGLCSLLKRVMHIVFLKISAIWWYAYSRVINVIKSLHFFDSTHF